MNQCLAVGRRAGLAVTWCAQLACQSVMLAGRAAAGPSSADPMFDAKVQRAGVISVSGVVVDRSGSQLAGVEILIRVIVANEEKKTFEPQKWRKTVDGSFQFTQNKCVEMDLTFRKNGYQDEERSFCPDSDPKADGSSGVTCVKEDLVVSLRAYGKEATLVRIPGTIRVAVPGTSESVRVESMVATGSAVPPANGEGSEDRGHGVFVEARTRDVSPDSRAYGSSPEASMVSIERIDARLVASSPEDGFVAYCTKDLGGNYEEVLSDMPEAPAGTYSNGIPIGLAGGATYFFVHLGERFGKGVIRPLLDKKTVVRELRMDVKLFTQPDGSRNLDSRYYR